MEIERFEDLKSWQEARKLAQTVYRLTEKGSFRFLDISLGSCKEVQSRLYIALDQTYVTQQEFDEAYQQADVVGRLINGTLNNLDRQIAKRSSHKPGPRGKPQSPRRAPQSDQ